MMGGRGVTFCDDEVELDAMLAALLLELYCPKTDIISISSPFLRFGNIVNMSVILILSLGIIKQFKNDVLNLSTLYKI
jgi:hypothetical protein